MDAYRLLKDELQHELMARGVTKDGSSRELRSRLHQALASNKPYVKLTDLDPEEEVRICMEKVVQLEKSVADFTGPKRDSKYKTIDTRLWHVLNRLFRFKPAA